MRKIKFEKINSINLTDDFNDKIFITLDLDWAIDELIDDTLNLLNQYDVKATWFITHKTDLLDVLQKNENFELGIHPNFNKILFNQDPIDSSCTSIITKLIEIVGGASCVRSHHLTQSSSLLNIFSQLNLTYDCNTFIPANSNIILKPWKIWNNLIEVPHFWEDDISMMFSSKLTSQNLLSRKGLKVFNFHPIHLFLNTNSLDLYEKARPFFNDYKKLKSIRSNDFGIRDFFIELIEKCNSY